MWLFLVLACGGPPPQTTASTTVSTPAATPTALNQVTDIDVAALDAARKSPITLIDVRTPQEYATGHVPGAVNIPIDAFDPLDVVQAAKFGDKTAPVYVICEVGGRSAVAAKKLAAAGYPAMNVVGGTKAWREQGLPVE